MTQRTLFSIFSFLCIALASMVGAMLVSCNSEDVITAGNGPRIILDNPDRVYEVKTGKTLTIAPIYENAEGATYEWKVDGKTVSNSPVFTGSWNEPGEYYIDLSIKTAAGTASEEMRVDVVALGLPHISLPFTDGRLMLKIGTDYLLKPEIANSTADELTVNWTIDGKIVSQTPTLHFEATQTGQYEVTVKATNNDGSDQKTFTIEVVDELPFELYFPSQSYFQSSTTRYTFAGRPICLQPIMSQLSGQTFVWSVDGSQTDCTSSIFTFTPSEAGTYIVNVTVDGMASASVNVVCVDATEESRRRTATASSLPTSTNVFEWVPAPGQFIGDTKEGGMTGNEATHESAIAWAKDRLSKEMYVSLGGFGGYIIVGFDHSIPNTETSYDFAIMANAFFEASTGKGGSNEPGIVYVSQDINGNGLPDDEWYELCGSETLSADTRRDYAITYLRPSAPKMNTIWTDNYGSTGTIDYLASFHRQDYYYPAWITADSYTLRGTCLKARTTQDPTTGLWSNNCFGWGYADNMGSDVINNSASTDGQGQQNGFKIKNAIMLDGTTINLKYIDFIRVQTGVNSKAGWLGEVSTEVFNFQDLSIKK